MRTHTQTKCATPAHTFQSVKFQTLIQDQRRKETGDDRRGAIGDRQTFRAGRQRLRGRRPLARILPVLHRNLRRLCQGGV